MSLEEKIKKLQRLQAKISLYQGLVANLQEELKEPNQEAKKLEEEHPGILQEFLQEVGKFSKARIAGIEQGETPQKKVLKQQKDSQTKKEVEDLGKALDRVSKQDSEESALPDSQLDPLTFLRKYKHLDKKKVKFTTKDGEITGTVKGLVVPNIVVETDTGYTVKIPPIELTELSE